MEMGHFTSQNPFIQCLDNIELGSSGRDGQKKMFIFPWEFSKSKIYVLYKEVISHVSSVTLRITVM